MEPLDCMITIVNTEAADGYLSFFHNQGVQVAFKAIGYGSATAEIRKYLGLGEAEKRILIASMPHKKALDILGLFDGERQLRQPGTGIAFTVPISSVAGNKTLAVLTGKTTSEGELKMKSKTNHELVLAIAARGHIDTVMDAARKAGAAGGTIIHALGSEAGRDTREFYSISVGSDRELIMILVKSDIKDAVMKQIADKAGLHTQAQCLVFSLPVNGVAGVS